MQLPVLSYYFAAFLFLYNKINIPTIIQYKNVTLGTNHILSNKFAWKKINKATINPFISPLYFSEYNLHTFIDLINIVVCKSIKGIKPKIPSSDNILK